MSRTFVSTSVRDAVAQKLTAHPEVIATGAKVVARARGQLVSEIQQAIARLKLGIVVLPCEIVKVNPNTPTPVVEELRVSVAVSESKLNDGVEGEELAELLLVLLHGVALTELGEGVLLFADEGPVRYDEAPNGLAITTVFFRCTGLPAEPA